jgi:ribosome assembly protein 1
LTPECYLDVEFVYLRYLFSLQVKSEVLGKMYAVLGKRHGRIVSEHMVEGSSTFTVTAHLPVVESLQFANEIRHVAPCQCDQESML